MINKKYIFISVFIFIFTFSTLFILYLNLNKNNQKVQYNIEISENNEFVWEIKDINHSYINSSNFWDLFIDFDDSFTEFDVGAKMKIKIVSVKKINNDTEWFFSLRIWGWTSQPFTDDTHTGFGGWAPINPEPDNESRYWSLFIFTPCDKYLNVLFSSNPLIGIQDNMLWFNISDYKIERTYDSSTGILFSYKIYFHDEIVFLSELV